MTFDEFVSGDAFEVDITLTQEGSNDPQPLDGLTIEFVYGLANKGRDDINGARYILSTAEGGGVEKTDPAAGRCKLVFTPEDSARVVGVIFWQIRLVDGQNRPRTIRAGTALARKTAFRE